MTPPFGVEQALHAGVAAHNAGNLAEAERLYHEVLRAAPGTADAWHLLGIIALQRGNPRDAVDAIRRAVAASPSEPSFHLSLGKAFWAMGDAASALRAFDATLAFLPAAVEAHVMRGAALTALGRHREAVAALESAEHLRPGDPDLPSYVAAALIAGGRPTEAVAAGRRALRLNPAHAGALINTATGLRGCGELAAACRMFETAAAAYPGMVEAWHGLGHVQALQGHWPQAAASFEQAVQAAPGRAEPRLDWATALVHAGRWADALAVAQALTAPDLPAPLRGEAFMVTAAALQRSGRLPEAAAAARRAAEAIPTVATTHFELGMLESAVHGLSAGVPYYEAALRIDPDHPGALANLGDSLRSIGRLDEAMTASRRAVERHPQESRLHSSLLYALHFQPGTTAEQLLAEHGRWAERHVLPLLKAVRPHDGPQTPGKRLRIGYVSAELYTHPVGRHLLAVLEAHDRDAFEIFVYSGGRHEDDLTARCKAACGHWRPVAELSDDALATAICADKVDILVDCSLHMPDNRMLTFARRPARVQLSHFGYPSTTGSPAMDYRVTDDHLEPPGAAVLAGPERVARLPGSWWLFADPRATPEVRPRPAVACRAMTFGSLNNPAKSSSDALRQWAALLHAVPNSRLLLLTSRGGDRWVADQLVGLGVAKDRVELVPLAPRGQYLAYYHRVDIVVDPFPYTGHSTSLDALWMGVPVLSRVGKLPVSRAGASLAQAVELPSFIVRTEAELVARAAELAGDISGLARLSGELRERMRQSALMDAHSYARALEAIYRDAWAAAPLGR